MPKRHSLLPSTDSRDADSPSAAPEAVGKAGKGVEVGPEDEWDNDDNTERDLLRKAKAVGEHFRHSQSPGTPESQARRKSLGGKKYTHTQIADHYKNCLELSSANKINIKNAFQLHLIDYMSDMLMREANKDENNMLNFQMAGCTIDAGTKIYACRVDAIHAETYRIASGLGAARGENTAADGEMDDSKSGDMIDNGDDNTAMAKKMRKKKSKRRGGCTIEKNPANLQIDVAELKSDADPWFLQWIAAPDNSSGGTILKDLHTVGDTCMYELPWVSPQTYDDIERKYREQEAAMAKDHSNLVDITNLWPYLERVRDPSMKICPELKEFRFGSSSESQEAESDAVFDLAAEPASVLLEAAAAAQFPNGFVGGDDSVGGGYMEDDMGEVSEHLVAHAAAAPLGGAAVQDKLVADVNDMTFLLDALSLEPLEYSYFKPNVVQLLDGPRHWKLLHKPGAAGDVAAVKGGGPRVRNKAQPQQPIYFTFTFNIHNPSVVYKRTKRKRKQLSADSMDLCEALDENTIQWREGSFERHPLIMEMKMVTSKPNLLVNLSNQGRGEAGAGVDTAVLGVDTGEQVDVDNYHYDNDLDNSYCPPTFGQGDEDIGNTSADLFGGSAEACGPQDTTTAVFTDDKLLQQPYKVEAINIGYAKTAKKIDIKRVKKCMWYIMTNYALEKCVGSAESAVIDTTTYPTYYSCPLVKVSEAGGVLGSAVAVEEGGGVPGVHGTHLFTRVYQCLGSKLSGQSRDNLSMPIAFVCLLHLANEKKLDIRSFEDGRDLVICQG